jgi:hypothetical protein
MAVDSTTNANGLKTVWDTIVAPKEAFESIRSTPTWGWALLIAIVVATAATYLVSPAFVHGYAGTFAHQVASDPRLSTLTPDQQQSAEAIGAKFVGFSWIFVLIGVPVFVLISSVVFLIFDKLGHGSGSFSQYWAAACNIAVPGSAFGSIVLALIVSIRGADSYNTIQEVQQSVPSLAMLAPGAGTKVTAFLGVITPFTLWAMVLAVLALLTIGKVGKFQAWLAALVMLLVPGLLAAAGQK